MTSMKLTFAAIALIGLSACDDSSSLGGAGKNAPGAGGTAGSGGISQSALDPASIAYFNEATEIVNARSSNSFLFNLYLFSISLEA